MDASKTSFKLKFFLILLYLLVVIILSELDILPTPVSLVLYAVFFPIVFISVRNILNSVYNIVI